MGRCIAPNGSAREGAGNIAAVYSHPSVVCSWPLICFYRGRRPTGHGASATTSTPPIHGMVGGGARRGSRRCAVSLRVSQPASLAGVIVAAVVVLVAVVAVVVVVAAAPVVAVAAVAAVVVVVAVAAVVVVAAAAVEVVAALATVVVVVAVPVVVAVVVAAFSSLTRSAWWSSPRRRRACTSTDPRVVCHRG